MGEGPTAGDQPPTGQGGWEGMGLLRAAETGSSVSDATVRIPTQDIADTAPEKLHAPQTSILEHYEAGSCSEWGPPAQLMLLGVLVTGGLAVSPWSPHPISSLQLGTNECINK